MGAVLSAMSCLQSWLKAGYDLAESFSKGTWEAAVSLFEQVRQWLENLLSKVVSSVSYTKERFWMQSGTTRTEVGLLY